jgi:hypothetical protein
VATSSTAATRITVNAIDIAPGSVAHGIERAHA